MIKAGAFITIEKTLSARLIKELGRLTKAVYAEVGKALSTGDYDLARELVGKLSLGTLFEKLEKVIKYQTHMGMLFGASRVTTKPGTSVVGLGHEKVVAKQMTDRFRMEILSAETMLKDRAMQLIAEAEAGTLVVEKADNPRVLRDFESFMNEKGEAYFNMVSSLHTSRVSAYGFTAEAMALGLEEYQINEQLDSRTCPVCRMMHGKRFKVAEARRLLDVVTRVTNPDDLKALQPWPGQSKGALEEMKGMTSEELVTRGWHIPPFHPGCRGLLARVGTVVPLDSVTPESEKPEVSDEDFKTLGLKITESQLKQWMEDLGVSPALMLSLLSGKPLDVLLAEAMEDGGVKESIGIEKFSLSKTALKVILTKTAFGKDVVQKVTFGLQSKKMILENAEEILSDPESSSARKYLQSMYLAGADAGMQSISLKASGAGSYLWAKRGFVPDSAADWDAMKKDIRGRYIKVESKLSEEAKQAIETALASDDPKALADLADLGLDQGGTQVGKTLLEGLVWSGKLTFTDSDSMDRFMSYVSGM